MKDFLNSIVNLIDNISEYKSPHITIVISYLLNLSYTRLDEFPDAHFDFHGKAYDAGGYFCYGDSITSRELKYINRTTRHLQIEECKNIGSFIPKVHTVLHI